MNRFITNLPYDVQEYIYQHVLNERKPKQVLTQELKDDIETYHLLHTIKENYKQIFSDYYLDWIENALINVLNDNEGFLSHISPCLQQIFPNLTNEQIIVRLLGNNHLEKLWIATPPIKRIHLFLLSYEMF